MLFPFLKDVVRSLPKETGSPVFWFENGEHRWRKAKLPEEPEWEQVCNLAAEGVQLIRVIRFKCRELANFDSG